MPNEADCLFCGIVAGRIPAEVVHQDDRVLAFRDIDPKAPVHVLVIPKRHVTSLADAKPGDDAVLGALLLTAAEIARAEGVAEAGYRTVVNTRDDGGQTVGHLHVHLLAGRAMRWPPG